MAKLNMAKINTLIKKGYLLAGVIMAANIFVINEMRATENDKDNLTTQSQPQDISENDKGKENIPVGNGEKKSSEKGFLDKVLSLENTINLVGGALFTLANSYYKFYENKPGFYFDYYFAGWNSNPFAKGYLQFCPNINLGRGILWLIPGAYNFIKGINSEEKKTRVAYLRTLHVSYLVANYFKNNHSLCITAFIGVFLLQGFVSMPLILHLSNFSISISLDSLIWAVIGKILEPKDKKDLEEIKNNEEEEKPINDIDDTKTETNTNLIQTNN